MEAKIITRRIYSGPVDQIRVAGGNPIKILVFEDLDNLAIFILHGQLRALSDFKDHPDDKVLGKVDVPLHLIIEARFFAQVQDRFDKLLPEVQQLLK